MRFEPTPGPANTGACVMAGDYYMATGESDYSSFLNWSVVSGQVNLLGNGFEDFLPGNGLYVQLAEANKPATIETIDTFTLNPGDSYQIQFSLGGNNELFTPDANQTVQVFVVVLPFVLTIHISVIITCQ